MSVYGIINYKSVTTATPRVTSAVAKFARLASDESLPKFKVLEVPDKPEGGIRSRRKKSVSHRGGNGLRRTVRKTIENRSDREACQLIPRTKVLSRRYLYIAPFYIRIILVPCASVYYSFSFPQVFIADEALLQHFARVCEFYTEFSDMDLNNKKYPRSV